MKLRHLYPLLAFVVLLSAAIFVPTLVTAGGRGLGEDTADISASPSSVSSGQQVILSWSATNVGSCSISPGVGTVYYYNPAPGDPNANQNQSGTVAVYPTATTDYTISCYQWTGAGNSYAAANPVNNSVTITVSQPSPPSAVISANPSSITSGQSTTLSWSSSNASSCSIDNGIGGVATSGSRSVSPSSNTTYTVTCTGAGGSANANTTVSVGAPDLTANTPPNYVIGLNQSVTVSGTVVNNTAYGTAGAFTNIFVTNIDGSGTYWHTTYNTSSAALGAYSSSGTSTTFPAGTFTSPGNYLYQLCANYNSSWQTTVPESNTANNCSGNGTITVTAPDLVASPGAAIGGSVNQAVTLTANVINQGNGSTGAGFHNLWQVTQSDQATVVDNENSDVGTLGAGASQGVSHATSYTFSTPGTYYYRLCADNNFAVGGGWAGNITESNEGNNCSGWQSISIYSADITPNAVPNLNAVAGQPVTFSGTVANIGAGSSVSGFNAVFLPYNSANNNDQIVSIPTLYAYSTSGTVYASYAYPSAGTYSYAFCADIPPYWSGVIPESNEGNNCTVGTVTVSPAPVADLTASNLPNYTILLGQDVSVAGLVSNIGNAQTTGAFNDVFVTNLDGSGTYWHTLYTTTTGQLNGGGTGAWTSTTFPSSLFTSTGSYAYDLCANYNSSWQNSVAESNYGNNCAPAGYITVVAPDLTATAGSAITSSVNQAVTLSATAQNIGSASTGASFHNLWQVTQSDQATVVDNENTDVGTLGNGASQAVSRATSYTFPTPGTYYYRLCTDNNFAVGGGFAGNITESNEGNNCSSWQSITISAPDITATTGSAVNTGLNQAATLSGTVTSSDAPASSVPSIVHICDGNCATINTLISTNSVTLAQGGTATVSANYTPTTQTQLFYQICGNFNTSWQNVITESNYGNNCGAWGALNVLTPDITAASGPALSALTNQGVTLTGTVTNSGNGTAAWFPNSIQICDGNCATLNTLVSASAVGSLGAGSSAAVSGSYTFSSANTYYYRICGNNNTSWQNIITESNYGNNCSSWTGITISAPTGGITANPNPCTITSGTSCTTNLTWTTSASAVQVWVRTNGGSESDFSNTSGGGSASAPGIGAPGNYYDFTMYDYSSGSRGSTLGTVRVTALEANLTANTPVTANATLNQAVTLSSYAVNSGNGSAGYFPNIVQVCDGSCATVNTVQDATGIGSLAAGSSQYISSSYTPTTYTQLYYRFCSNYNTAWQNVAVESNYGDNCSSFAPLNVTASDLTASAGSVITSSANQAVTISATVINQGGGSTNSSFHNLWQVTLGDQATVVDNENTDVGTLGSGASQAVSHATSYTFPSAGTYYYRLCADNNFAVGGGFAGNITESNEGNNCSAWQSITIQSPDLTATPGGAITSTINQAISLSATVANQGGGSTLAGFHNLWQVTLGDQATVVDNENTDVGVLSAGGSAGVSHTTTYTFSTSGTYYYRLCADNNFAVGGGFAGNITESNENNNCSVWQSITINAPDITAVTSAGASATLNQAVTLSGSVINSGSASPSFPSIVRVCDYNCATINNLVTTNSVSLAQGASANVSASYTPTTQTQLYYQICGNFNTSWQNIITESNYGNNCGAWQALTVTVPNIVANVGSAVTSPLNQAVTLSGTVGNTGSSNAGGFPTLMQVCDSGSGCGSINTIIAATYTNSLGSGATSAVSASYTPNSQSNLIYRFCGNNNTSWQNIITESNYGDNCSGWQSITVTAPDLTAYDAPQTINAVIGQPFTMTNVVKNIGTAATPTGFPNSFWVDSANFNGNSWNTTAGGNIASINAAINNTLGVGASQQISATYTINTPGTYYYAYCTDIAANWAQSFVFTESNTNNNCYGWGTITVSASDLTATPGPALRGTTGTPLTLSATAQNIGSASTGAGFHNLWQVTQSDQATVVDNENTDIGVLTSSASQAASHATSYTFPSAGTYYYRLCADNNFAVGGGFAGNITESNEGNNCSAWQSITIAQSSGTITASPNPCNVTSGSSCSTTVTWNSNVSAVQVWTRANGGNEIDFSNTGASGSAASTMQSGSYYDFTAYDYSSGARGATLATVRVLVTQANITAATSNAVTTTLSQATTLSGTVTNAGTGPTSGGFSNIVQVCDSNCATINSVSAATTASTLAANASQSISGTYTPLVLSSDKQLYYRMCANFNTSFQNIVNESNYGDDCGAWQTLTVNPPIPGPATNLQYSCNITGTAVSVSWTPSQYTTTNYPRFTPVTAAQCPSGWQEYTDGQTCYPNPDTWTASSVTNFPVVPNQAYYWYVASGNTAGVNWATAPGQSFTCAGLADLTARQSAAAVATTNHTFSLSGTVVNSGNTSTSGGFWNLLQICNNTSCSSTNTISETWTNQITPSGTANVSSSVTAPSTAGNYLYRWCANNNTSWQNIVAESDYGNNCGAWAAFTVNAPPAPTCSLNSSSNTIVPNQPITLTWGSTDATSCTGVNFSTGGASSGSTVVTPPSNTNYAMSCTGEGGTCNAAPVTIGCGGIPVPTIHASSKIVSPGSSVTLTLGGTNVNTSCVLTSNAGTLNTYPANYCSIANPATYNATNIQNQTKFCFACDGGTPACVTVNVTPKFLNL